MKKGICLFIALSLSIVLMACGSSNGNSGESSPGVTSPSVESPQPVESEAPTSEPTPSPETSELTFGDTFEFDGLEITFSSDIQWKTIDNEYSDINGAEVVAIPIVIKNISNETHGLNMFYYTVYGSKGTEVEAPSAYFDDSVDFVGEMRSGATQESMFYMVYDGDGDYFVEFDNFSEKLEVKLPIQKNGE